MSRWSNSKSKDAQLKKTGHVEGPSFGANGRAQAKFRGQRESQK